MFDRISRLFKSGKLDMQGVYNAIARGFITRDEFEIIVGTSAEKYEKMLEPDESESVNTEEEAADEQ